MAASTPERWATKAGVILAVAGSAVGLGNFLRFPTQAALYGGGAFMIPYFCAFLLLGMPLMWCEWALGRRGGSLGRHSLPGIYLALTGRRWARYLGVLGIFIPFVILVYYTYIQSWTLGFSVFSILGRFRGVAEREAMEAALLGYLGIGEGLLSVPGWGLLFLGITLALNFWVIYRGVSAGIERLSRIAMPLLFIMAIVLMVRVLTLRGVGVATVGQGLDFLWRPDFGKLRDASVWLAAAGQIFFTLSLGLGAIITYSSYVRPDEDIALKGLTSASLNEFCEVILGASIAIPAAVVFFGAVETTAIAQGGSFNLGFMAMPVILQQMPLGDLLGMVWFLLLFFAGVTSSVSLMQPMVAFLHDEFGWSRRRATVGLFAMTVAYIVPVVLLSRYGFLDEMDFWACNMFLVLGALVEVIVFVFLLGIEKGWEELTRGASIRLPVLFRYTLQYVTPLYLLILLGSWTWQQALPKLWLEDVDPAARPVVIASRLLMLAVLAAMLLAVRTAFHRPQPPTTHSLGPHLEEDEEHVR